MIVDGVPSNRKLAKRLGVTENTVSSTSQHLDNSAGTTVTRSWRMRSGTRSWIRKGSELVKCASRGSARHTPLDGPHPSVCCRPPHGWRQSGTRCDLR